MKFQAREIVEEEKALVRRLSEMSKITNFASSSWTFYVDGCRKLGTFALRNSFGVGGGRTRGTLLLFVLGPLMGN